MARTPLLVICVLLSVLSCAQAGFRLGGMTISQVNTQLSSLLLPQINALRASAHPTPDTPLEALVWDDNLAKSAGQWASKCIIEDNSDDFYSGKVGETITQLSIRDFVKNTISAGDGIKLWAAQNATYDYTSDSCFEGEACADYRQLVWSTTKKIGCATNICNKKATLVCQYLPFGNFPGVRPFASSALDLTALEVDLDTGNFTKVDVNATGGEVPEPPKSRTHVVRGTNNYKDSCKPVSTKPTGECATLDYCKTSGGRSYYWGSSICGGGDNVVCCIRSTDYVPANPTPSPSTPSPSTPKPSPSPSPSTPSPSPSTPSPSPSTPSPSTPSPSPSTPSPSPTATRLTLPTGSYNWRGSAAVTPVKNQQSCGSCWAFSSSAAAESAYAIKTGGTQIDLAEQRLVNCVSGSTCNGGNAGAALPYIQKNGDTSETDFPYTAKDGTCPASFVGTPATWTASGDMTKWDCSQNPCKIVPHTIQEIKDALVKYGPVVVYVYADDAWNKYSGTGVLSGTYTDINHAVLLVGYDSAKNAWVIKNSWDTWWGDKGYCYVDVNNDFGMKQWGPYWITA
eukprot:TRINITY_DN631_c0_g1_i1.p1 TRINITY_DN631_c0_g1~~TRINITY_DN631_c0_g1_i1.p1  ORF type:complete len:568 (-),score=150.14 TRINITY_DN631_c0_g1_i1:86-1789(-)